MKLYNFHTSSTSFRVRIALHLKGLAFEYVSVALGWEPSYADSPEYRAFNPQANVPVLVDGDVKVFQSLAIIEYLEARYPTPSLLPADDAGRARVRALALIVACEVQPLNNLRTERYLASQLGLDDAALRTWRRHWIGAGFDAFEAHLASPATGRFCHGDVPTLADCFLVPQVRNALAHTVEVELARWPTIARIYEACKALPAFQRAHPTAQPGYQKLEHH